MLQRQKRKVLLHYIMTSYEKCIHYDNPKCRRLWGKPSHTSTSSVKLNIHGSELLLCIWWDQLEVVYYEMLSLTKTMGNCYQLQLMCLSWALKKKWPLYEQRQDKVILQHDHAQPHVTKWMKTYLEMRSPTPSTIFTRHCLIHPIITYSDWWHMAWLSSTFILMKMPKMGQFVVSLKRHVIFRT